MPDQVTVDKRLGERRSGNDRRSGYDRRNPSSMIVNLDDKVLRRITGTRRTDERRSDNDRRDG